MISKSLSIRNKIRYFQLSGKYWESCWDDEKALQKELTNNVELQDALWKFSVEEVGQITVVRI